MPDLSEIAKTIFLRTVRDLDPSSVIKRELTVDDHTLKLRGEEIDLDLYSEVALIGMGKASVTMGAAVESILGERIKRGILVTDRRPRVAVRSEVIVTGHPLPDSRSLLAAQKIIALIESCDERSLIIFLVSGGGSSLVELSIASEISLEDLRASNQVLVGCGASIREINLVRKSLSRIKAGRLGYAARHSRSIALFFSDVNPGDIRSIASNPLLAEEIDLKELSAVVDRYGLLAKLPPPVVDALRQTETTLPDDWVESRPLTALLLDNSTAVHTAVEHAKACGFRVEVADHLVEGDYEWIAKQSIERLLKLKSAFPGEPVCVISGGEASCPVRGDGVGGRNQEFVLYSAALLAESGIHAGAAVLSCGTDGIDGNSKAAGAVASPETIIDGERVCGDARRFISSSDTHSFFRSTGGLVMTGPTGNNVRDLRILMAR